MAIAAVPGFLAHEQVGCGRLHIVAAVTGDATGHTRLFATDRVMTAFEVSPSRVRNIFICAVVVFCASSRITKASESVRPRI